MRVRVDTDVELYPQTTMQFGDEIDEASSGGDLDVPDEVAARWKQARDTWRAAQREAGQLLGVPG
jgi:hypothetical protein